MVSRHYGGSEGTTHLVKLFSRCRCRRVVDGNDRVSTPAPVLRERCVRNLAEPRHAVVFGPGTRSYEYRLARARLRVRAISEPLPKRAQRTLPSGTNSAAAAVVVCMLDDFGTSTIQTGETSTVVR